MFFSLFQNEEEKIFFLSLDNRLQARISDLLTIMTRHGKANPS